MKRFLIFLLPCLMGLGGTARGQSPDIDTARLGELQAFSEQTLADGILLLHRGAIVHEWYNPACDSVYMGTASAVKSWTALVIGRLLQEGKIKSIDQPACDYLPEWKAGCAAGVTIRHLLTMTSGIRKRTSRTGPKRFVFLERDFNEFVLQMDLDTLPGAEWSYSNEAVQLLAPLIERASGLEAGAAFRELLFEPLGMDSTSLFRDPAGNAVVFGGARTTLRDFARIGLLMAAGGRWNDRQLLPAGWARQAVTPIPQSPRYGFLWWIDPENGNYAAMGDFGQLCIVYPEQDLIYLRYQTCRNNDPSQNLRWMGPDFLNLIKRVVRE